MSQTPDLGRRRLFTLKPRNEIAPLRPPWASADAVADRCTRCGDCIAACPEAILTTGDGGFPTVDFSRGECTFCGECAGACGAGVFGATADPPWQAVAVLGEDCLARRGVMCQSCGDACPERAIRFRLTRGTAPQPAVDPQACTGCGACVAVCPADAVAVRPAREEAPA